ncbi:MAG: hypothetical protein JWL70_2434 [Acidimicrobiia bacterium]|nr:hypothetical protein [Acidimicrobiia bacterium]
MPTSAATGPYESALGSALVTMVEPEPGHEIAYNRWYEDDHFYAGGLAMPWLFAGRRWVAPSALRALRYPDDSPIAQPITDGRYITLYWVTRDRADDHIEWSTTINQRLHADKRNFPHRRHVFTMFQDYLGAVYREPDGPRDIHALDYPYPGMVVEVVDSDDGQIVEWLAGSYAPQVQPGARVAQTLLFRERPIVSEFSSPPAPSEAAHRITMIHFLDAHPADVWAGQFADHGRLVTNAGRGRLVLCAPFVPTRPGTNDGALE